MTAHIRAARPADVDPVVAIEQTTASTPWPAARLGAACGGGDESPASALVAVAGDVCCGFLIYSEVLDEITLLKLAVLPDYRRHGIGLALLEALGGRALECGARRILLEVSVANAPALGLYRRVGFVADGRRTAYYSGRNGPEDALLMSLSLGDNS
jgi:ribosomal-protein-alanine N-acetyltransferase